VQQIKRLILILQYTLAQGNIDIKTKMMMLTTPNK